MYDGPIREGTRGGAGDFRWSQVKDDKHRENYLGHSIQAPVGRWQNHKDIHWYNREDGPSSSEAAAQAKREEIRKLKEAEEEALAVALGYAPRKKAEDEGAEGGGAGTGANAVKVEGGRAEEIAKLEKEEKKREKA
ncbi:kinase phosphorylation protein-domain-containing protein [Kockovaella imperatae]|uniref:Kinase phosphorylation protein-domain-containing protein n=1 Tax=Kockovaella imperatae TaxID=4999 RepID=A0A1Y1UGD6_9TREE|nr:kinase phosphorylation protein-domain-containing protein [Kockovaella imperatae]ORX36574.1 kinase phosphorylation protein-domain-containing protein [Kockovaella imperatae]